MERTSLRLGILIKLHLEQIISRPELNELLKYVKDPLFEDEVKQKLSMLFEESDPEPLKEDEQNAILENIFGRKHK